VSERWPDFLIIGAQKAGTSWLHARLREQPSLWLPPDKDYEFFSYPGASSEAAYRARFVPAPAGARVGDACASYFWTTGHSDANPGFARDLPGTIDAALGPDTRYIVLLRDPVERAVSAYLHHLAFGSLTAGVSLLDAQATLGLVDIGRYGHHLEAWIDRVGVQRMCVLPAPGERPPTEVLASAIQFLGGTMQVGGPDRDAPVFEGMARMRNESGVWIPSDVPGVDEAVGPRTEVEQRVWVRVIAAEELKLLAAGLASDRLRLIRQLEKAGMAADWVRRWSGEQRRD
jgi:hypothetical protein